jgi:hypothetical protein
MTGTLKQNCKPLQRIFICNFLLCIRRFVYLKLLSVLVSVITSYFRWGFKINLRLSLSMGLWMYLSYVV